MPFLPALLFALQVTTPAPAPVDDAAAPLVTVTGERLTKAEVEARASGYVRAVLATPAYDQFARWHEPVCLKLSGITDAAGARVAARLAAIAGDAGAQWGKPGCRPNLQVVFSEDAAVTAGVIARRKPKQISRLTGAERDRLLREPLPVRFWHALEMRSADGVAGGVNASAALSSAQSGGGTPLGNVLPGDAPSFDSRDPSLIKTTIAVWITSAVVIVDVGLANGKSLDSVADYVGMVSLAPLRLPPVPPAVPSVLSLFAPAGAESPAAGMTSWDRAFLSGLYSAVPNRSSQRQRGQIVAAISADLAR
ncbi:MAG: hypothetical protein CFE37_09430 [Alphaproteobacteria bacterium PA4]|nr:MAG: hypothetical protein CFE37_09430 [Alphaproteobacteria bacterium PA4]